MIQAFSTREKRRSIGRGFWGVCFPSPSSLIAGPALVVSLLSGCRVHALSALVWRQRACIRRQIIGVTSLDCQWLDLHCVSDSLEGRKDIVLNCLHYQSTLLHDTLQIFGMNFNPVSKYQNPNN